MKPPANGASFAFGQSAGGLAIPAWRWETDGPELLVLGGVHGDETEGVVCAQGVLDALLGTGPCAETAAKLPKINLTLAPRFNMDGVTAGKRVNGNGVDLNRNLPSTDWNPKAFNDRYPPGPHAGSEPENI